MIDIDRFIIVSCLVEKLCKELRSKIFISRNYVSMIDFSMYFLCVYSVFLNENKNKDNCFFKVQSVGLSRNLRHSV